MNYILSVSYANEKVATKSYNHLARQVYVNRSTCPCEVVIFDNHYPLNSPHFLPKLCSDNGFMYQSFSRNVGCYEAYNALIHRFSDKTNSVILFDGDNFVTTPGWHQACFEVMQDTSVGTCMVSNAINNRELHERGYNSEIINGHKVKVSKQVICCTVGAWSVPFLKEVNGITAPHRYYGGNEVHMWDLYRQQGKKLVVLEDFHEELDEMKAMQDWQYEEYKILYAHRNLAMSFEQYLKTEPKQFGRDVLIKEIFG